MAKINIALTADVTLRKDMEAEISYKEKDLILIDTVVSDLERATAYDAVTQAKKQIKKVGDERLSVTRILDAKKKEFMDIEKQLVSDLTKEVERVSTLVVDYDKFVIQQANAEQERFSAQMEAQRAEQQKQQDELSSFFGDEPVNDFVQFVEAVPVPTTQLPKGTTGVKSFRIVDFSKVPDIFKELDTVKVREAMKNGIEISGIEYFIEQKTTFR